MPIQRLSCPGSKCTSAFSICPFPLSSGSLISRRLPLLVLAKLRGPSGPWYPHRLPPYLSCCKAAPLCLRGPRKPEDSLHLSYSRPFLLSCSHILHICFPFSRNRLPLARVSGEEGMRKGVLNFPVLPGERQPFTHGQQVVALRSPGSAHRSAHAPLPGGGVYLMGHLSHTQV